MWETVLAIRHRGCPVSDTSKRHPDVHLQNVSKSEVGGHRSKRILCLRGDAESVSDFAAEYRAHEGVEEFTEIAGGRGPHRYFTSSMVYMTDNPSIAEIVSSHGCYQHNTVNVKRGIEHWVIYAESKSQVREVVDDVEGSGNDVDVQRSVEFDDVMGGPMKFTTLREELTPRQETALSTALELGYYTDETDVSVEDIAAEMDVHSSTAWEHLSKAENAIVSEIGERVFLS